MLFIKDVNICVQIVDLSRNFGLLYLCSSELVDTDTYVYVLF